MPCAYPVGMITPEAIIEFRQRQAWSQAKLAAELGVNQATVSRLENGHGVPDGPVQKLLERMMVEANMRRARAI